MACSHLLLSQMPWLPWLPVEQAASANKSTTAIQYRPFTSHLLYLSVSRVMDIKRGSELSWGLCHSQGSATNPSIGFGFT